MAFPAKARARTTPTVKPLVTMNKKNIQSWELKLGLPQIVVLVGVLTGSMACAFGIGYVTGQRIGFENALASSVSSLPKYPIVRSDVGELDEQDVRNVYAELESNSDADQLETETEVELPDLEAVKTVQEEPVVDDLVVDLLEEEAAEETAADSDTDIEVRVLGEDRPASTTRMATLGSLVEKKPVEKTKTEIALSNGSITAKTTAPVQQETVVAELPSQMAKISTITPDPVQEMPGKKVPAVIEKPVIESPPAETGSIPEPSLAVASAAENSRFLKGSLPRGWYAQVAAPEGMTDANSMATMLSSSGFPVVIEKATVRGQTYYRVLVGPEDDRKRGEILLGQVKRERYLTGQPFIRMVK